MADVSGLGARACALLVAADQFDDAGLRRLRSPSRDAAELARTLEDPAIGGYMARPLVNKPTPEVLEEIEGFFAEAGRDDLLLLYLSCHGVKDPGGQLHFATKTTRLSRLASTSVPADFVYQRVDRSKSRRIVVLLDCCYSGAYPHGHRPRSPDRVGIEALEGRGRVVITSCTATEYAFESGTDEITGTPVPSVFTAAIVEGLRSGRADRDEDGLVSVDDLYGYVVEAVRARTPYQTPEMKWGDVRGALVIARNPRHPAPPPRMPPDGYVASTSALNVFPGRAKRRRGALVMTRRRGMTMAAAGLLAGGLSVAGWELSGPGPGSKIWSFPVTGTGGTGPVVANGVVYVNCWDNGKPQMTYFYALRAADGTQLWSYTGRSLDNAVIADGMAYIAESTGDLSAMRGTDGRRVWLYPTAGLIESVAVSGGVAYVSVDGDPAGNQLLALHAGTGTRIWSFPGTFSLAFQGTVDGVLYPVGNDGRIYALRAATGTRVWHSAVVGTEASQPVVSEGTAFTVADDGRVYALRTDDGTTRWNSAPLASQGGIEVAGNAVYLTGSEELFALRASDGKQMWRFPVGGSVSLSPLVSGGVVLIINGTLSSTGTQPSPSSPGDLIALRVSDGKQAWRFPVGGGDGLPPLVSGGVAYIGTPDGQVHALDISTGRRNWSFETGGVVTDLIHNGSVVYAGSGDHNVYALDASDGTKLWSYTTGGPVSFPLVLAGDALYVWGAGENVYALRAGAG